MNFDISNTVFGLQLAFDAHKLGWKVPILRFLGAEEVSAAVVLEPVISRNVV